MQYEVSTHYLKTKHFEKLRCPLKCIRWMSSAMHLHCIVLHWKCTVHCNATQLWMEIIIFKDKELIKEMLSEHFSKLLSPDSHVVEDVLDRLPHLETNKCKAEPPSSEEQKEAIKMMGQEKSADSDGIPSEVFKNGGSEFVQKHFELFQSIWASEALPVDLRNTTIMTIFISSYCRLGKLSRHFPALNRYEHTSQNSELLIKRVDREMFA